MLEFPLVDLVTCWRRAGTRHGSESNSGVIGRHVPGVVPHAVAEIAVGATRIMACVPRHSLSGTVEGERRVLNLDGIGILCGLWIAALPSVCRCRQVLAL